MRFAALILAALIPMCRAAAAEADSISMRKSAVAFGAKAGFSSASTYLYHASIDGHNLRDYRQDTQLGNFIMLHVQYGLDKLYLQSGLGIGFNKSTFYLDMNNQAGGEQAPEEMCYSYRLTSLMIPVQLGYSIVNQQPYRMAVYGGPRMRILSDKLFDTSVTGIKDLQIEEKPSKLAFGMTLGMTVQIGRTFFDMEYETVLSNISDCITVTGTNGNTDIPDMELDRKMGIFSFSYGFLF